MKKLKQYQPFSEIPSPMLWEILGRVPIKTCLTCKLVCKEWYHIIVSPDFSSFRRLCNASRFTILFYNGRYSGGYRERLIFNLVEHEKTLDGNGLGKRIVPIGDLIRVDPRINTLGQYVKVMSQCNGVVCWKSGMSEYFVCNLLTSQCVKLKPEKKHRIINCELGCCPVSGQFKVLILLRVRGKKTRLGKIQTLGNGEWRNVGRVPWRTPRGGCYLGGSSHWCGLTSIWSFHFGKEKFLSIPFPDDIISATYKKRRKRLGVLDSCLCLTCFSQSPDPSGIAKMDIWIMKEYGVHSSWVRMQMDIESEAWRVPLVQMNTGKILLKSFNDLYLCDSQTRIFTRVRIEVNGLSSCMVPLGAFDARFFRF